MQIDGDNDAAHEIARRAINSRKARRLIDPVVWIVKEGESYSVRVIERIEAIDKIPHSEEVARSRVANIDPNHGGGVVAAVFVYQDHRLQRISYRTFFFSAQYCWWIDRNRHQRPMTYAPPRWMIGPRALRS